MKTTSHIILYANDINFDDASAEWLLNKKKLPQILEFWPMSQIGDTLL